MRLRLQYTEWIVVAVISCCCNIVSKLSQLHHTQKGNMKFTAIPQSLDYEYLIAIVVIDEVFGVKLAIRSLATEGE